MASIQNNSRVPFHQKEMFLMQFESVKRWLNGLRNEATKRSYVNSLFIYCQQTQMSPDALIDEKAKTLQDIN